MKTKIILEFGCNHQGSLKIAEEMINQASKLGVWGVKFQKRTLDLIPSIEGKKTRSLENSFGESYLEHRRALEFSYGNLKLLKDFAHGHGLRFICTAFDTPAMWELAHFCDYIKLPSQKFSKEKYFIEYENAKKKFPNIGIMVSSGMHSKINVLGSDWIDRADVFMHCNSLYPVENPTDLNFGLLRELFIKRKGVGVGYSSHDKHANVIANAMLCGAEYVERHFTLNKKMKGSDHETVSSDYTDIHNLMGLLRNFESMMSGKEELSEAEKAIAERYEAWKKE